MVLLKYLSNFWRTLEIPLINREIIIFLTWSEEYIIVTGNADNQKLKLEIIDTKLYVPVVTLSAQDNSKLEQLSIRTKITDMKLLFKLLN